MSVFISLIILYTGNEIVLEVINTNTILLADAAHICTDVLSNLVVLVAIIVSSNGFQFDKIAAIVVGFIAKTTENHGHF